MDVSVQRRLVNQRLGLDVAEKLGIDTSGIFSNEDLTANTHSSPSPVPSPSHATSRLKLRVSAVL